MEGRQGQRPDKRKHKHTVMLLLGPTHPLQSRRSLLPLSLFQAATSINSSSIINSNRNRNRNKQEEHRHPLQSAICQLYHQTHQQRNNKQQRSNR